MNSDQARALYERLNREGEAAAYFFNPDVEFVLDLMYGLLMNEGRRGYQPRPCRLAEGVREKDLDIICPCDYHDADLDEYGACSCALYVSEKIAPGQNELEPVLERRGTESEPAIKAHEEEVAGFTPSGMPVWRCRVCGYLCARPQPPLECPVCKVDKERFARLRSG